MRLVLAGWGLTVLVAVLILVVDPGQLGFALILALLAVAMAAWVWRRATRAALISSLVLGLLLLLSFGAYTIAGATEDEFDSQILVTDIIGLIGGLAIVAGAVQALVEQRRQRQARTA
jgi:uncharacterized membrane protein